MAEDQGPRVVPGGRRQVGDPIVRAVARLPVTVRTKLLIAFVGTALLLVAVGLLGQLVLGQSNDRVASVGPLQKRAVQYSQLQADAEHLADALASVEQRGGQLGHVHHAAAAHGDDGLRTDVTRGLDGALQVRDLGLVQDAVPHARAKALHAQRPGQWLTPRGQRRRGDDPGSGVSLPARPRL